MSFRAYSGASKRIPPGVRFRVITEGDREFLQLLYSSTRQHEMDMLDWAVEQKEAFLRQQFEAQHRFYTGQFKQAEFLIVEMDGQPAGRVYIDRRKTEIRLVDIALLPAHRKQGLGGRLLEELLQEGQDRMLPVTIHVEKNNPAMRLYLRLGFIPVEDQGVYDLLRWQPSTG